ncbi:MAG: tetratricopeptide repeat protein [Lunatimonas sp.]|nr:tetratricopeptide repeat protein [Lunatimonas sp.]MCC5936645.1 tetratricopeptide repeat protein [Lunatimonas sp.]
MRLSKSLVVIGILFLFMTACGGNSSSQGDIYFQNEQYEEAIRAYEKFLETKPKNVKALYNRGRAYEEVGDLEQAEASFKRALEVDTKNTQIMLSLSNLYHKRKSYELSLMYADNAVAVSGAPSTAYFMKGRAMHQLGNVNEALREYNAAIKMSPGNGQYYYYRGMLHQATDKKQQACNDLRKAVQLNFEGANEAVANYCQ